jgi:hypothetical protein
MERQPHRNEMTTSSTTTLQSDLRPQALWQWRAEDKGILIFFSSRVVTGATHYMATSSKTHRNAQLRCQPQNPCTRKINVCGVAHLVEIL